jgi:hypothetical protein
MTGMHLASLEAIAVIAILVGIVFGAKGLRRAIFFSLKSLRNDPRR